jgi:DNA-binding NarL/FixJ family response regulator
MGLIDTLDQTEVKVLACLVEGMSRKDIASCFGLSLDEVEHSFQSTMKKLQADRIAEAVRIGLSAGLERPRQTTSLGWQAGPT